MDSFRRVFALLILALWAPFTMAWSGGIHSELGKAAFAQLTPQQKNAYTALLEHNKISRSHYPSDTQIGYLTRWPDHIRQHTLQALFNQYGSGTVPRALEDLGQQDTRTWHYENALYADEQGDVHAAAKRTASAGSCPPARDGQLFRVWPRLVKAYQQADDPRDQALLLSFILHMASDAYQPLHVMAGLDHRCRHDRGGNGFCVKRSSSKSSKRCRLNLHQAWDRGFGVFEESVVASPDWPVSNVFALEPVLKMHRQWAGDIYPTGEDTFDSAPYRARAEVITKTAASRAVAHLAQLLAELAPGQVSR